MKDFQGFSGLYLKTPSREKVAASQKQINEVSFDSIPDIAKIIGDKKFGGVVVGKDALMAVVEKFNVGRDTHILKFINPNRGSVAFSIPSEESDIKKMFDGLHKAIDAMEKEVLAAKKIYSSEMKKFIDSLKNNSD